MNTVYGVDFASQGSVIVRATRTGRQTRFATVAEIPPAGASLSAGMPVHETFARRLIAPLASVDKARKVLPSLLDVQLPFPLEKCVHLFPEVVAKDDRQTEALAVAARLEDVATTLRRLNDAGFDPVFLDHEALALWTQSVDESTPGADEVRAILYIGQDRCALALGRGIRFLGALGARQGRAALAGFIARIGPFLRSHLGETADTPFAWAIVGPGADDTVAAALNRPADTPFLMYREPAAFLARALANRALTDGLLRCNLRLGDAEHPAVAAGRATDSARQARICMAAGVLLTLLSAGWLIFLKQRDAQAQRTLATLASDLSGMPAPKGQEVVIAQRALDERTPRAAPLLGLFDPSILETMAGLLKASGNRELRISSLTMDRRSVELSGSSPSWSASEALDEVLKKSGWSAELKRGDVGADESVPFSVKASR